MNKTNNIQSPFNVLNKSPFNGGALCRLELQDHGEQSGIDVPEQEDKSLHLFLYLFKCFLLNFITSSFSNYLVWREWHRYVCVRVY